MQAGWCGTHRGASPQLAPPGSHSSRRAWWPWPRALQGHTLLPRQGKVQPHPGHTGNDPELPSPAPRSGQVISSRSPKQFLPDPHSQGRRDALGTWAVPATSHGAAHEEPHTFHCVSRSGIRSSASGLKHRAGARRPFQKGPTQHCSSQRWGRNKLTPSHPLYTNVKKPTTDSQ